MGRTIYIAFLVILVAGAAFAQPQAARVTNSDSSANVSKHTKQSAPTERSADSTNDLTFEVKIVPGTFKKLNVEMVSPKSGYAEVSLLNSRGDVIAILHTGKVRSGLNTYIVDSSKVRPGMYYVVSKYESGVQVADKVTVLK